MRTLNNSSKQTNVAVDFKSKLMVLPIFLMKQQKDISIYEMVFHCETQLFIYFSTSEY